MSSDTRTPWMLSYGRAMVPRPPARRIDARFQGTARSYRREERMSGATVMMVYATARERVQAEEIGMALVKERLAACANVLDHVHSFYWWQGEMQQDSEALLILKTTAEHVDRLIARLKALHSYD